MSVQSEQVLAQLRRSVPEDAMWIVTTLERHGFETWIVGGAVRDAVFGPPVDWDFTTRAKPDEVRSIFRRTVPIGLDHGTVGVLPGKTNRMYEVTTFRKDVETTGRHAVVEFAERVVDDLSRRDFTFNAVAWHPVRGELLDPHGGLNDLREGILRTVGEPSERFGEDYLRILRALRFAGRLELRIHPDTWAALVEGVPHLTRLSGERVREEILKVLSGARPSRALVLYRSSGALRVLLPELVERTSSEQFEALLETIDSLRPHRVLPRLAVLMRAGGVGREDIQAGADRLRRLRFSNEEVAAVVELNAAPRPPNADVRDAEVRRWLSGCGRNRLNDLLRIRLAEAETEKSRNSAMADDALRSLRRIRRIAQTRPPLQIGDLQLDGNDLVRMGLKPGPHFKVLFRALLDDVLEEPTANTREKLEKRVRQLERESDHERG